MVGRVEMEGWPRVARAALAEDFKRHEAGAWESARIAPAPAGSLFWNVSYGRPWTFRSAAHHLIQHPIEGQLEFLIGFIGPGGDLAANLFHPLVADFR